MARKTQHTSSLAGLGLTASAGREAQVTGLSVDSRQVEAGHLFAALPGASVHGAAFIEKAVSLGAVAVLTDAKGAALAADALTDIATIVAQDPRQTLAQTASLWFGAHPSTVVAVTGTNGKTSVSTFARQIWEEMDLPAVNLGTTGVEGAWNYPLKHTTPEPITLHRVMAEAARNGITYVAMEASSHGLDQRRLDGVMVAAAAFTNFTQDHLDYPKGTQVAQIALSRGQEVIGVGRHPDALLRLKAQRFDSTGQDLLFDWNGRPYQTRLSLIGGFQADNVLLAVALVIGAGADPEDVFETLPHLTTVRGRMELAATRESGASVFVDYAHTPDAIATALKAMRPHVMGKIIAIVGAGGDRDTTKRPLMGAAASEHADVVIVTDDNPRSEDPSSIRAAVLAGALNGTGTPSVTEVGDRAEAILRGVDALGPGDALLIAGKGHESGQTVGDTVLPFDDVEQASVAVAALEGRI